MDRKLRNSLLIPAGVAGLLALSMTTIAVIVYLFLAASPAQFASVADIESRYGPPVFAAMKVSPTEEYDGLAFSGVREVSSSGGRRLLVFSDDRYVSVIWDSFVRDDWPKGMQSRPAWFFPRVKLIVALVADDGSLVDARVYSEAAYMYLDVRGSD